MDSGNSSGSMQSSSGGDEEYDSRTDQSNVAAFLNPSGHFGCSSNLQPPHQHHQLQSHLYDPSPIFGAAFSQSPSNPVPNSSLFDAFRSGGLRSDHGHGLPGSSSSAPSSSSQSIIAAHQGRSSQGPSSQPSDQTTHHGVAPRNPKKRTRASRRAPTTVLTTDTSNFRAMVQEFTGIPAPPFSGSLYSRRLDLFGHGSGLRSGQLEPLGSIYPLRPSAQKVHQQSLSPPHSFLNHNLVDATNSVTTTGKNNNTISLLTSSVTTTSSSNIPSFINYQLPSDLAGLSNKQPQNMLNMQNQMSSFQSLLQPQHLHSSFNVPASLGAKLTTMLPLPSFEELGMNHGHVDANLSGLPIHHVTTTTTTTTTEGNDMRLRNDSTIWRDHERGEYQLLRPFVASYSNSLQSANGCKFNHSSSSASSSDFHHHYKGLENVSVRGEGSVDPWNCPSTE